MHIIRNIFTAMIIGALFGAGAPSGQSQVFGGPPCLKDCKNNCKNEKKTCQTRIKRVCRVGKWLGVGNGSLLCNKWNKDCDRSEKFCRAVGCMNAPRKCGGGWGDPHMITLDGAYYNFQGVGEFVFARSDSRDFDIQFRTKAYGSRISVISAQAVRSGNVRYTFEVSQGDKTSLVIKRDGELTEPTEPEMSLMEPQTGMMDDENIPVLFAGPSDDVVILVLADETSLRIERHSQLLNISIGQSEGVSDFVGMLGDFDGETRNDLTTRTGEIIDLSKFTTDQERYDGLYTNFGNSWRVSQDESLFDYPAGQTTFDYTDMSFPPAPGSVSATATAKMSQEEAEDVCRAQSLISGLYFDVCVFDVMMTGEEAFAIQAGQRGVPSENETTRLIPVSGWAATTKVEAPPSLNPEILSSGKGVTYDVPIRVNIGETFSVTWELEINRQSYIELTQADVESLYKTSIDFQYAYRRDRARNPVELEAPEAPGTYLIRMVDDSVRPRELIFAVPIEVVEAE